MSKKEERGLRVLSEHLAEAAVGSPANMISDTEALLIHALGLQTISRQTKFKRVEEWAQVRLHQREGLLDKLT